MNNLKKAFHFMYTLTYFISLVPLKIYDILHGTEFSGIQKEGEKDGYYEYYPSPVFSFPSIRKYVRQHMQGGRGHSVLDIGCGKGFVLLFFSSLSFDSVAGIEYDKMLCNLARKNLKNNHRPITVYDMDALDFPSYKDYDTFYLYNPFHEAILEQCIHKIILTLEEKPRKLTVFYCNPRYEDCLIQSGFQKAGHFYYKTNIYVFNGETQ